jgi:hypothetical protein
MFPHQPFQKTSAIEEVFLGLPLPLPTSTLQATRNPSGLGVTSTLRSTGMSKTNKSTFHGRYSLMGHQSFTNDSTFYRRDCYLATFFMWI